MLSVHGTGRALLAALLIVGTSWQPASSQIEDSATMTVLRGEVAVVRPDGSAVQPAPSGTVVRAGDEIRTVSKSGALITFFVGTEIELGEETVMVVERVSRQGDLVDVSLKQVFGASLHRIQTLANPGSSYRVNAGGAVTVIRGTTFLLLGPTSTGHVVLVCTEDCDSRSSFNGVPLAPEMGYFVEVSRGAVTEGPTAFEPDFSGGIWGAAFEGATTAEQDQQGDTRGIPAGQVPRGHQQEAEADRDDTDEDDAFSATFAVNSTLDEPDALPGDGRCVSTPSAKCTLRAAIMELNAQPDSAAGAPLLPEDGFATLLLPAAGPENRGIFVPEGRYKITRDGGDDTGQAGDFDIRSDLTIRGEDAGKTVINGNNIARVFDIRPSASAVITDLAVENGNPGLTARGGGIRVGTDAALNLRNVRIEDNTAGLDGAGIFSNGTLVIEDSTIRGNTGTAEGADGAGVTSAVDGRATLRNVTVEKNRAHNSGGGIGNFNGSQMTITDSTIRDNVAESRGGGGVSLNQDSTLTIKNSIVRSNQSLGTTFGNGGGIIVGHGKLVVEDSTISENTTNSLGGGVANVVGVGQTVPGDVTIRNSTISDNTAASAGGGVLNTATSSGGSMTIVDSTISGNSSGNVGGGVESGDGATLVIRNSLIVGNSAVSGGGLNVGGSTVAINANGSATVTNVTITNNSASSFGGGARVGHNTGGQTNTLTLVNATVTDNDSNSGGRNLNVAANGIMRVLNTIAADADSSPNCAGTINSLGNNLEDGTSCGFTSTGDLQNTDPLLDSLDDNGGPTRTQALSPGSPAIDAGSNSDCPATDQRGRPRPRDGNGDTTAVCDIGAFEVQ